MAWTYRRITENLQTSSIDLLPRNLRFESNSRHCSAQQQVVSSSGGLMESSNCPESVKRPLLCSPFTNRSQKGEAISLRHALSVFPLCFLALLAVGVTLRMFENVGYAQATGDDFIPAMAAFNSPGCSDTDLGVDPLIPDLDRGNPEWKAIILDSGQPPHLQPPTILEGFVLVPPLNEGSNDQAP